jgi:hypothetical protein
VLCQLSYAHHYAEYLTHQFTPGKATNAAVVGHFDSVPIFPHGNFKKENGSVESQDFEFEEFQIPN